MPDRSNGYTISETEWNELADALREINALYQDGDSVTDLEALGTDDSIAVDDLRVLASGSVYKCLTAAASTSTWEPVNGVYNVKDFGALGDDDDDDAAVAEAVTAVAASGGVLFFPAGTYRTSTTIDVDGADVTFRGEGRDVSIIKNTTNTTAIEIAGDRFTIQSMTVQGDISAGTSQFAMRVSGAISDLTVKDVRLLDTGADAFRCLNASEATADTNKVTGCVFEDVVIDNCVGGIYFVITYSSNIEVRNLVSKRTSTRPHTALLIDRLPQDVRVFGGRLSADQFGIAINNAQYVKIDGTYIHDLPDGLGTTRGEGVHIERSEFISGSEPGIGTYGIAISNVTVKDAASDGFFVQGTATGASTHNPSREIRFKACRAESGDQYGFRLQDCQDVSVTDCEAFDNDEHGLLVVGNGNGIDPTRVQITGGSYRNNGQDGTGDGIRVVGSERGVTIRGVDAYDDQGTATQRYGISWTSLIDIIEPGDLSGNDTDRLSWESPLRRYVDTIEIQTTDTSDTDTIVQRIDVNKHTAQGHVAHSACQNSGDHAFFQRVALWARMNSGTPALSAGGADDVPTPVGDGSSMSGTFVVSGNNLLYRAVGLSATVDHVLHIDTRANT